MITHNKCSNQIAPSAVATHPLQQDVLTFYGTLFRQKEAQRADSFRRMSEAYECDFVSAEDRRDRKISNFKIDFEQTEDELDQRFEDSQISFSERFRKKETFRKNTEQLRTQAFDDMMRTFPISLDQMKSSFTSRMEAMERDEAQHAALLTAQATQVLSSMELAIRASQEARKLLFEKSFVESQPINLPVSPSLSNLSSRSTDPCSYLTDPRPPLIKVIPPIRRPRSPSLSYRSSYDRSYGVPVQTHEMVVRLSQLEPQATNSCL